MHLCIRFLFCFFKLVWYFPHKGNIPGCISCTKCSKKSDSVLAPPSNTSTPCSILIYLFLSCVATVFICYWLHVQKYISLSMRQIKFILSCLFVLISQMSGELRVETEGCILKKAVYCKRKLFKKVYKWIIENINKNSRGKGQKLPTFPRK